MSENDAERRFPGMPDVIDEKPFGKALVPMSVLGAVFWLMLYLKLKGVVGCSWVWIVLPGVADVAVGAGWMLGRRSRKA